MAIKEKINLATHKQLLTYY